ncbi:YbjN domain-containing protein [Nocardiopsis sp. CNT312]|uniref:YbjN domain-containing protein n=1 Tax=Nocardiopsis sp. CNT312 TaxID=1137268 RepID=UPI00048AD3B4|nr:YbjN domain-containing protein [Nocardiopsis sp. CNT312]
MATDAVRDAAERAIVEAVAEAGLEVERPRESSFLVTLPGTAKLKTLVWLEVGPHSLTLTSFFCRQPDENHAVFYRWLMGRNSDMFGMAFAADEVGDVYIRGRLPLSGITPEEVDRLLGCVLTYSDENFNAALERGFASAIRKEWIWRAERGHDMRNLKAFAHLAEPHHHGGDRP